MTKTAISEEQRFTLLAALGANMDWSALTVEQVQVGVREPQRAGREMTLFVQEGFRVQAGDYFRQVEDLAIEIPALPRPSVEDLQSKYDWIDRIERDSSPTAPLTLVLGTVLREGEEYIDSAEYQHRLRGVAALGYQHLAWLVEHQDEHPAFKALLGQIYVDGPAIVVVFRDGIRGFACLVQVDRRWCLHWLSIGIRFHSHDRVASASGK